MEKVASKDGTPIAFERSGTGPPLILVDGALCHRAFGPMPKLVPFLTPHFTVITYDRRGRGDSGDKGPYSVEREVEDIEALIQAAGGSAFVYGISSGAALVLEAAARTSAISRLVVYEPPFIVDGSRPPIPKEYARTMKDLLAAGKRGAAVKQFMRAVGVPGFFIFLMQFSPVWTKLKAIAHTLAYDTAIVMDHQRGKPLPEDQWAALLAPTLVLDGGKSPAWMRNSAHALADVLPNAEYNTLPGQTHMLKPSAIAPVLVDFFKA
jgi:pimeloyl-ACP methyl ester carboxylesterase